MARQYTTRQKQIIRGKAIRARKNNEARLVRKYKKSLYSVIEDFDSKLVIILFGKALFDEGGLIIPPLTR